MIRVVERGRERRLLIGGEIQSIYFPAGDWSPASREYWGRALVSARSVRPHPRVLLVGLGGGTQVHLLQQAVAPRLVAVIEHDPAVIRIAQDWFGLDGLVGIELLCADAAVALRHLAGARRRFDFVVDDISYAAPVEVAIERARRLAALLARDGVLVLNQHRRPAARVLAGELLDLLPTIRLERVRPSVENVLVIARSCREDSEGAVEAPSESSTRRAGGRRS